jgi:PAS domain S-box-containing protein
MNRDVNRTALEVLLSVSRELATTLDLHKVLTRVLAISTQHLGVERASLVVLDDSGKPIDAAILYEGKLAPHTVSQMQDVATSGLAGWVIANKRSALISNTQEDERWLKRPGEAEDANSARSALCVPLMARNKIVGVLTIVHPHINFFTEEQLKLQQAIADLAGIAVRNAQLYADVETAGKRYYDLFDDSIDPIFITTLKGRIIEANRQAVGVTGIEKPDLVKTSIIELHDLQPNKTGTELQLIKDGAPLTYESQLKCSDCTIIPVEVHVSTVRISGSPHLQWIFRDISERKYMEELREDLSAMIYHDLRSPLANILSSLEILRGLLPEEDANATVQLVDIAQRSSERLQRLISSLLDLHHLESGQQIEEKKPVDLPLLINEAVEIITPTAVARHITVEQEILGTLPLIPAESEMLRRVLVNLLENAIKFSPQRTNVLIAAKQGSTFVTVWVEDRGPGIPPEHKERIFSKFIRLKGDSAPKGHGLGLAFCRLAVQAHGGTIWVEDTPEGGSRFLFTLPTGS